MDWPTVILTAVLAIVGLGVLALAAWLTLAGIALRAQRRMFADIRRDTFLRR